ncbi:MAG: DUF1080 domain-containing protein [Gemmataceae bacterium]
MKKWFALIGLLALLPAVQSQPPKRRVEIQTVKIETFTDATKAGPDFAVQGEYVGEAPDGTKIGSHVVADGEGKFSGKSYKDGLPGDGWDGTTTWKHSGTTDNGVARIDSEQAKSIFENGKLKVTLNDGGTFTLTRIIRKSPTEGQKPPANAVVLFDGTKADAWEKGELVEGNLLKMGVTSKQKFGDCTMHVEFRTPFMPLARGQARGNSGVYVNGCYEVQVLDSFGLEPKNNECAGLYQQADPTINMCYPPLSWQTYDIDFTAPKYNDGKKTSNARITVKHNGVVVQNNVELKQETPGGVQKEAATGPIHLQNHSNPVYYRNIWVVAK